MKKLLKKDLNELTEKEFKIKWNMLKFDMGKLNLQKQSKKHLIEILELYKEFKKEKKNNG